MKEIDFIISKSITSKLDNEDQKLLDDWIAVDNSNAMDYQAYVELWNKSETLVLPDFINVEESLLKTKERIAPSKKIRVIPIWVRQVAAVLVLSVTISALYNYFVQNTQPEMKVEQTIYQEIEAAYGTKTKVILADGTKVWLNSGSTLRFPTSFQNAIERRVEINGEGYFDVTKNDEKPFIVNTSKLDVKVYGTQFNVCAYEDYDNMTIALVEGKVSLLKKYGEETKELIVLNPEEVVEYNKAQKKLYHSANNNYMKKYTSWKEGQIVFFGDPIERVVNRLEKWYNVDISVTDNELNNYSFTATFIDESLEQVLHLLCISSNMKCKIIPAKKLKDNSFSKRIVELSAK